MMKIKWKKLLICLLTPLAIGGLSTLLSGGMGDFQKLEKPPLSPPGWVFPIVWTVLYLLMGYASYRVLEYGKDSEAAEQGIPYYGAQLLLNFLWPIFFFGCHWYLVSFFVLVLLFVAVYLTSKRFAQADVVAGDLMLPYLLWIAFAGYLNLGVYLLN